MFEVKLVTLLHYLTKASNNVMTGLTLKQSLPYFMDGPSVKHAHFSNLRIQNFKVCIFFLLEHIDFPKGISFKFSFS